MSDSVGLSLRAVGPCAGTGPVPRPLGVKAQRRALRDRLCWTCSTLRVTSASVSSIFSVPWDGSFAIGSSMVRVFIIHLRCSGDTVPYLTLQWAMFGADYIYRGRSGGRGSVSATLSGTSAGSVSAWTYRVLCSLFAQ